MARLEARGRRAGVRRGAVAADGARSPRTRARTAAALGSGAPRCAGRAPARVLRSFPGGRGAAGAGPARLGPAVPGRGLALRAGAVGTSRALGASRECRSRALVRAGRCGRGRALRLCAGERRGTRRARVDDAGPQLHGRGRGPDARVSAGMGRAATGQPGRRDAGGHTSRAGPPAPGGLRLAAHRAGATRRRDCRGVSRPAGRAAPEGEARLRIGCVLRPDRRGALGAPRVGVVAGRRGPTTRGARRGARRVDGVRARRLDARGRRQPLERPRSLSRTPSWRAVSSKRGCGSRSRLPSRRFRISRPLPPSS